MRRLSEIIHTIELRISPAKDRGMRCRGQRNMSVSAGEHYATLGERIQVWSEPANRTKKSHAVGPSRVKCDEDDVGRRTARCKSGQRTSEYDPSQYDRGGETSLHKKTEKGSPPGRGLPLV